ncbi:hypothetical protein SK128_005636, partial [Halocaridina rubra]
FLLPIHVLLSKHHVISENSISLNVWCDKVTVGYFETDTVGEAFGWPPKPPSFQAD